MYSMTVQQHEKMFDSMAGRFFAVSTTRAAYLMYSDYYHSKQVVIINKHKIGSQQQGQQAILTALRSYGQYIPATAVLDTQQRTA